MWPFGGRFFPGTNLQDLNLDWIVQRVRDLSRGIIAPFINTANNHWMVWDTDAETFVDSGVSAAGEGTGPQGEPGKSPIIGSNGHWYTWDVETSAYTDTGIDAQGPTGPQGERGPGQNRNLLDNCYFIGGGSQQGDGIFPINQRGQQSYELGSGQYGIDRWRASGSGLTELLQTDGVVFGVSGQTAGRWFRNATPTTLPDGKYTFSALVTGLTVPESGDYVSIGIGRGASVFLERIQVTEPGFYSVTVDSSEINSVLVSFVAGKDASIKIAAMKLERADTQTLAHQEGSTWVLNELPDYGDELFKCQRYFQMFRTEALRPSYALDCRPVMASEPTPGTLTLADVTYYTLTV